jgi:hypothetical protein
MKRLVLLLALLLFSFANGQTMSMEFLEGSWAPESPASYLTFSGLTKKDFNIKMVSTDEGNPEINVVSYQFNNNNFYLESFYEPNSWECIGKFVIIDKNTIAVDYVSNASAVVIYRRELTN